MHKEILWIKTFFYNYGITATYAGVCLSVCLSVRMSGCQLTTPTLLDGYTQQGCLLKPYAQEKVLRLFASKSMHKKMIHGKIFFVQLLLIVIAANDF